jgi:hypothetical protein
MAKLTSQQRDHFVNRIHEQFKTTLGPLEKVAASKKAELVEEKFDEFVESLGLKTVLDKFAETEQELISLQQTVANHMTNLNEQYDLPNSNYGRNYEWSWSNYGFQTEQIKTALLKMCREECEIAFKSIPEGQEIEKLKNKKTEAIDYIMGYDQQAELLSGLSSVLHGSGVMMLQEYKETK